MSIQKSSLKIALLIVASLFILALFSYYQKTIFLGPSGTHQWRQADCYSIAKNYYKEGMRFGNPQIHFQGTMQGHAVSEFPILNYTAAALWTIFGETPLVYRLMNYTIFCIALLMVGIQLNVLLKSPFKAWLVVAFLLVSPLLTYYAPNFIADVPAWSISIMAFVMVWRFYVNPNRFYFITALLLACISILLKASNVIPAMLIGILVIQSWFNLKVPALQWIFKNRFWILALLIGFFLAVAFWYRWALAYNHNFANNVFLLTVLPIWKMQTSEILDNLSALWNQHFPIMLNPVVWLLLGGQLMYCFFKRASASPFLNTALLVSSLYSVFYMVLFFQVFKQHDYYLITLLIWPMIIQIHFWSIVKTPLLTKSQIVFYFVAVFIFLGFALHAAAIHRLRLIQDDKLVAWYPFISTEQKKLAAYLHWDYARHIGSAETIEPQIRSHGISREATFIAIPDQSFNIALHFIDQKGWTVSLDHLQNDSNVVISVLNNHPRYLLLMDTQLQQLPALRRVWHRMDRVFHYKQCGVYKIQYNAF